MRRFAVLRLAIAVGVIFAWSALHGQDRCSGQAAKRVNPAKAGKEVPKDEKDLDAPYVPTPQDVVEKMLVLAKVKKEDLLYDLGCGDGRILVTAAKTYGCKAIGVDLDPRRVREAKQHARIERVDHLVTVHKKDLFTFDFHDADVVALYLYAELNERLIPEFEKLKPGTRIVSHSFEIPGIKPARTAQVKSRDGIDRTLYLYVTPLKKKKDK
jgi:SAM-dependent methyltransferase